MTAAEQTVQDLSQAESGGFPGKLRQLASALRKSFVRRPAAPPPTMGALTELGIGDGAPVSSTPLRRRWLPALRMPRLHQMPVIVTWGAISLASLVGAGVMTIYEVQHDKYLLHRSEQAREMGALSLSLASLLAESRGIMTEEAQTVADKLFSAYSVISRSNGAGFLGATDHFEQEHVLLQGITRAWEHIHKGVADLEAIAEDSRRISELELRLNMLGNEVIDSIEPENRPEARVFIAALLRSVEEQGVRLDSEQVTTWARRQKLSPELSSSLIATANDYFGLAAAHANGRVLIDDVFTQSMQLANRLQVYADSARLELGNDAAGGVPILIAAWVSFAVASFLAVMGVAARWREQARREQELAESEFQRAEHERQRYARQEDETMEALIVFNDMADGDFTQQFEVTDTPIGTVKASANIMMEHVRGALRMTKDSSALLDERFNQVEHVFKFLRKVEAGQKDTAERSAGLASQVNAGMSVLADNADRTSEAIGTVNQRTDIGVQAASSTLQSMTAIRGAIQDTNKRMKKLGESIQEIMKIAEVLQRMADQSNVLAMNTALQASQINDRRMTVLAEEVGKLSESLGQAMVSIGQMGQEIGADARDTIASMERSVQFVIDGTRQMDTVREALSAIMEAAQEVSGAEQRVREVITAHRGDTATMARLAKHSLVLAKHMGDAATRLDQNVVQMRSDVSQLTGKMAEFRV